MIRITDKLWIGNSADGRNLEALRINCVLNVAYDLRGYCGWPDVEYMQVGLIDGPGNPLTAYYAAILALETLTLKPKSKVLMCCHSGSRSIAVAIMHMNLCELVEHNDSQEFDWWMSVLDERVSIDLTVPHEAHREAYSKINWKALAQIMEAHKV